MYCLMRYIPMVEGANRHSGWGMDLLKVFGLLSIMLAAAFMLFQNNLKRFLAYSSMEHIGIISLGLGLGHLGIVAALFHTLNHSLCKTLSFFAAGRLGQMTGSHRMDKMKGMLKLSPVWGTAIFISILALTGIAPFSLFISEFLILKAAVGSSSIFVPVVFILGISIIFVGALGHIIPIAWGSPDTTALPVRANCWELFLVIAPLAVLLLLGLYMPKTLFSALNSAANIIGDTGFTVSLSGVWP
jgi:hydrogenase-4 component F